MTPDIDAPAENTRPTGTGEADTRRDDDDTRRDAAAGHPDQATLDAVRTLTKALEFVERARGHLYEFHQLCGTADLTLGEAVDALREAGHHELADRIDTELVGRNVLDGRWSFQIVEEYDDGYWSVVRDHEREARDRLTGGQRHVAEAGMKEDRRTAGHPSHRAHP